MTSTECSGRRGSSGVASTVLEVRRGVLFGDRQQLPVDIDRIDHAGVVGETARKIAGPRADIGDGVCRLEIQCHHHVMRLLPLVSGGVFQHFGILGGRRWMVLMGNLPQRNRRKNEHVRADLHSIQDTRSVGPTGGLQGRRQGDLP